MKTRRTNRPRESRDMHMRWSCRARLRWLGGLLVVLVATLVSHHSRAGLVPLSLQAQLTARLGGFDRNFVTRAGAVANVLVVYKAGDADSKVDARSFGRSLFELGNLAGVPIKLDDAELGDPAALAQRIRTQHLALVYFSSGLEGEMPRIAAALSGVDVLTVGSTAQHAEKGAVVGFDLDEARPKIVLNIKSARAQNVSFKAELLKLARIIE